jgi:hypothetical protein
MEVWNDGSMGLNSTKATQNNAVLMLFLSQLILPIFQYSNIQ